MRQYPTIPYDTPLAVERYERQLRLMEIAKRISSFGIRFDYELAAGRLHDAHERELAWREKFCTLTGLPEDKLGESRQGGTAAVKKYFWETLQAPKLMFAKKAKGGGAQFTSPLLLAYMDRLPPDKGGDAALALVGIRAAARSQQFLNTYMRFCELGDGRVYGGFNSLGTKGDRWSSSTRVELPNGTVLKLNLQQVPGKGFSVKREGVMHILAEPLRDLWLPDKGCSWIKFDYDAQEARLLAYIARAAKLKQWIAEGRDIHMLNALAFFPELVAAGVFGPDSKKSDPGVDKIRDRAKGGLYAFSYSMAGGTYEDTYKAWIKTAPGMKPEYVRKVAVRMFETHPEVRDVFQAQVIKDVETKGYVVHPMSGGRLVVQPATGGERPDYRGYHQGFNYLMQSGGAHVFSLALLRVAPKMEWTRGGTAILALIHDEKAVQAPHGREPETIALVREAMEQPFELYGEKVSLPAEASVGPNWGTLTKYTPGKS